METILKKCSYWTVAILIAIPVICKGLFFEYDFSLFMCFALAAVGIIAAFAKEIKFSVITDGAILLLAALYGFVCLFAVNKGLAVTEFVKYIAIFIVYMATKTVVKDNGGKTAVLFAISMVTALSALISLLTATGLLNYAGAYSDSEIEKWLNGTVQYHNAFGALSVCGLFISSALNREQSKFIKISNAVSGYFIAFGMIMSYSRGAWVTAPIAFVVYMIFADKEARLSFFEIAATGVIATIAVLGKFTSFVESKEAAFALLWLFAGLLIYGVLYVVVSMVIKYLKGMKYFNISAVIAVCAIVILAVVIVLMPQAFSFILPKGLLERLSGINFGAETVKERFVFYKDAFEIAKRSLLFGSGGGAWQDLYGMAQSYYYSSTQTHSFVMQVLIETGLLGLIVWLFALVMFYIKAIKALISKIADRKILAAAVSGGTVLIAHSFIDFDLSISAVLIVLFAMFAVVFAYDNGKNVKINRYVSAGICFLMVTLFIVNAVSARAYERGVSAFNSNLYPLAYEEFSTSSSLRPFDALSHSYKAASKSFIYKGKDEREQIVADMEKAETLAPNSILANQNAISVYSNLGAYEVAMDYAKKMVLLQPMNIENYRAYFVSGYQVVSYYYRGESLKIAKKIADEVLEIRSFVEEINKKAMEKIEFDKELKEMLMYFDVVSFNIK